MMQPPVPGQLPPENIQRYIAEQERLKAVQVWYETEVARLEVEHRERVLQFAAILCRCWDREPCQVHGQRLITSDGSRVL